MQTECKRVQAEAVRAGAARRVRGVRGARGCRCTWAAAGGAGSTCPGRLSRYPPAADAAPPAEAPDSDRWRRRPLPAACALCSTPYAAGFSLPTSNFHCLINPREVLICFGARKWEAPVDRSASTRRILKCWPADLDFELITDCCKL